MADSLVQLLDLSPEEAQVLRWLAGRDISLPAWASGRQNSIAESLVTPINSQQAQVLAGVLGKLARQLNMEGVAVMRADPFPPPDILTEGL